MDNALKKKENRTTAIVLAAGSGKRMQSNVAKQFLPIGGKPVLCYSLEAFEQSDYVDEIILVAGADGLKTCKEIVERYGYTKVSAIVLGGKERYHSVWNGLCAAGAEEDSTEAKPPKYVLIHDGARPFVTEAIIQRNIEALENDKACVTAVRSKDTVKIADENGYVVSTPNRSFVWNMQTPQSFDFTLVYEAYRKLIQEEEKVKAKGIVITDDAMVVETFTGVSVKLIEGSYENIKITTPEDLAYAEGLLGTKGEV